MLLKIFDYPHQFLQTVFFQIQSLLFFHPVLKHFSIVALLNYLPEQIILLLFSITHELLQNMAATQSVWKGFYFQPSENIDFDAPQKLNIYNLVLKDKETFSLQAEEADGNSLIEGSYSNEDNLIRFEKKKGEEVIYFEGSLEANQIIGVCGKSEEQMNSQFMLKQEQLKPQSWNGYYCQFNYEHQMQFQQFQVEEVPEGKITGKGEDEVGKFELAGKYIYDKKEVSFKKQYIEQHCIYYKGKMEGKTISGYWGFSEGEEVDKFQLTYME